MKRFYSFFKDLYKEKKLGIQEAKEQEIQQTHVTRILDDHITYDELTKNIKDLKNGKANGLDNISDEFLKASNGELLKALMKLFNLCLEKGVYPWNTTVITPLHKKGDIYNPDNYRAIAVGINLGKIVFFYNVRTSDTIQKIHMSRHRKPTWILSTSPNCRPPFLIAYMY